MSDQSGVGSDAETPVAPESAAAEASPPAASPSPDFERIYERMDQMSTQQQQMAEALGQVFAEPESESEPYYDDEGELTEEGVRSVVADYVREQVEQQLAPREQAAAVEYRDGEWDALRETYPELQDREVANAVIADALRWVNAHNPDLVNRPEFVDVIEWVYKARNFGEPAQAMPSPVVLESAAGATRGKGPTEPDWGERIAKAAEKLRPQI